MSDAVAETPAQTKGKTQPIFKRKFGSISIALFPREIKKDDGTTFTTYSFALQKSWKKGDQWEEREISLDRKEILPVMTALQEAFSASYLDSSVSDEE